MSPLDSSDETGKGTSPASTRSSDNHAAGDNGMDSLRDALAGMQMDGAGGVGGASPANVGAAKTQMDTTVTNYSGTKVPSLSSSASSPFAIARDNDWGNFAGAAQAAFPTSTGNVRTRSPNDDVLEQSEAFDLFPSPNASKTLSNDVFRFSHPNLSGVEDKSPQSDVSSYRYSSQSLAPSAHGSFGEVVRPNHDMRRRTESPSCSVTGTTTSSRSVSPYTNSSNDVGPGRTIQAYQRYESNVVLPPGGGIDVLGRNPSSFADDDRSSSGYSLSQTHSSHPSLATLDSAQHRSPYGTKEWSTSIRNTGSPYDQALERSFAVPSDLSAPPVITHSVPASNGQQPQVLYMAVPSPDGRGQVLQPVQMVQLPSKTNYYVSPSSNNVGQSESGSLMGLPPLSSQGNEYPSPLNGGPDHVRTTHQPLESRSRVANYAMENSSTRGHGSNSNGGDASSLLLRDEHGHNVAASSTAAPTYPIDSAIAQLYAAPQRPPLEALLGQVRRLSRDQVGCRLVQQALDEEGALAATLILNEGLPFWGEAMVDPFGNYLFQKILEKITTEERILLVKTVSPRLVNASLNLHGTRSVQKVVELCSHDEHTRGGEGTKETAADILTAALAPAAARLCIDSHGNHVIQRILLKLGPKHTKFVFDAVAASVGDVARHRHGCCVIQRCLDSQPSEARDHLVRRIVEKSLELMQDAYGNYVVQYVLDVCPDQDVAAVCESVVGRVNLLSIQKFSSNVMEKCLERCSDRVKEMYLAEMSDPERIRELMMDPFGNYVVQRALSVATHAQAIRLVEAMKPHLLATQSSGPHGHRSGGVRNTAGGRRIIAKICRRFPNFSLSAVASPEELYSSNRIAHRHHQAPLLAATYAPVSSSPTMSHTQHFAADPFASDPFVADPRLTQGHAIPQTYYTLGGTPYYEPQYSGGHGGFPGM